MGVLCNNSHEPLTDTRLQMTARLTIGMMTYDDYDGVFFTVQSLRMYHPEVMDRVDFLVVDNNPDGPHGEVVRNFCRHGDNVHYCAVRGKSGSVLKNLIFELSPNEYTMSMDCHVLVYPGAIAKLLKFYDLNPECNDLLHGPLITETGDVIATEMRPGFRGENFGIWHVDDRGKDLTGDGYEIPMHGMGLFACRTVAWPRFASGTRGFGSEEGVIHEKMRLVGNRCYCLPFLRWLHRFGRPAGVKYPILSKDKIRNLLLGFREAQLPLRTVTHYWRTKLYKDNIEQSEQELSEMLEWAESLPPSPFPRRSEKPFLGHPIQLLD